MKFRIHRGAAMLQLLLSSFISLLIGAMLLMFVRIHVVSRQLAMDQHSAELTAWRPMHRLADNLRKAQSVGTGSATLSEATATAFTMYDDSAGTTSRYWLDSSASPLTLNRTRGTQTLVIATGMKALKFTYYLATGKTPSQGACWATTINPNAPTAVEMPNIVAVGVTITTTGGNGIRNLTTTVRLRNAPRTISGH
jgi:hypothetical protein